MRIRAMTEQDGPAASKLLGESWRRTYGPIAGWAETADFGRPSCPAAARGAHDDRHASFFAIGRRLAIDNLKTVLAVEGQRPIVALKSQPDWKPTFDRGT